MLDLTYKLDGRIDSERDDLTLRRTLAVFTSRTTEVTSMIENPTRAAVQSILVEVAVAILLSLVTWGGMVEEVLILGYAEARDVVGLRVELSVAVYFAVLVLTAVVVGRSRARPTGLDLVCLAVDVTVANIYSGLSSFHPPINLAAEIRNHSLIQAIAFASREGVRSSSSIVLALASGSFAYVVARSLSRHPRSCADSRWALALMSVGLGGSFWVGKVLGSAWGPTDCERMLLGPARVLVTVCLVGLIGRGEYDRSPRRRAVVALAGVAGIVFLMFGLWRVAREGSYWQR